MAPSSLNFYPESTNLPVARAAFPKPAPLPKAPIVNPYEKFTQPQFDAWIGDLTGALRDALDYRAETRPKPKVRTEWQYPGRDSRNDEPSDIVSDSVGTDEHLDDTFAEVVARQPKPGNAKGKGRDPREGPGLGRGDRAAPIEIDLDSEGEEEEEEEEESEEDEGRREWREEYEEEEEEEEEEDEDEDEDEEVRTSDEEQEEEEYALRNGESSARAHARYKRYADRREEEDDEEEDAASDAIQIISDNERDDGQPNGTVLQDDYDSTEEYLDRDEDADMTVAYHQEYHDEGEETGSESEEEDGGRGSSPLQNTEIHLSGPSYSLHGKRKVFLDEGDELEGEDDEPEIIAVDSDDEEADEFLAPEDEGEGETRPQLSIPPDEPETDALPGSSPILSSPIEPDFTPEDPGHEIYDVDELEEGDENMHDRTQHFDWDHPPAFGHGVPASGSGHLEFPVEQQILESEEDSPAMAVFGTSDLLPTFHAQPQTDSDIENWPSNESEEPADDIAEPVSVDSKQEYSVIEEDEGSAPDDLHEGFDAYTVSRRTSVDPQQFVVEDESVWGHETEPRGMSIDIVTVDGEPDREPIDDEVIAADEALDDVKAGSTSLPPDAETQTLEDSEAADEATPAEVQDSAFLAEDVIDPSLAHSQSQESRPHPDDTVNASFGEGIQVAPLHQGSPEPFADMPLVANEPAVQPNGHQDSSLPGEIPMPVSADPAVHDPYEELSTHILTVPASFVKQMQVRHESSLFTPPEIPSPAPTPAIIQDMIINQIETEENGLEEVVQDEDNQLRESVADTQLPPIAEPLGETVDAPALPAPETTDHSSDAGQSHPLDSNFHADAPLLVVPSATRGLEVDPYPYSLSTPGEHLESNEPEEISTVSSQETANGDLEENTQADETRRVVEMELTYTDGTDVAADDTPESAIDGEVVEDETENNQADETRRVDEMDLTYPDGIEVVADDAPESAIDGEVVEDEAENTQADETRPVDEMDLTYPDGTDVVADDAPESATDGEVVEDETDETDAAGDDDPDYVDSNSSMAGGADDVEQLTDEASSTVKEELTAEDTPYTTKALDVEVAEEEAKAIPVDDESVLPSVEIRDDVFKAEEHTKVEGGTTRASTKALDVEVAEEEEAKVIPADDESVLPSVVVRDDVFRAEEHAEVEGSTTRPPESTESTATHDIPRRKEELTEVANGPPSEATEDGVPSAPASPSPTESSRKRKRDDSFKELAFTSGNSGKVAESRLSRPYILKGNGKGKGKAKEEIDDDASSTSSASSAARILKPESSSSRASSVVSIIRAARPMPSPPKYPPAPPAPPPPPLMHAHSRPVLHRHGTSLARQSSQQRLTPSRNSVDTGSPIASSSSMPPLPLRPTPAGSPVTRSHCRYHKISLPEDNTDENSVRAWFLVPGCSLGDTNVMEEEDVKDEGDPTDEDKERWISDLDTLNLDANLMGALRHLVGVELLREQEVFYLPRPDEEPRVRKHRRRESKLRISSGGSFASESGAMSPRSPASTSTRPPNSSSTASVQARNRKKTDRESRSPPASSQDGDSTDDDDESPADKRIREAEAEGIAAAAADSPVRTRRRKRIDKGAAEYKPPDYLGAIDESSEEEGGKARRKKKKTNGRGVKRRQSEAGPSQEGEDRRIKKLKTEDSITSSTL